MNEWGFDTWIYEMLPIEDALERLEAFGIRYGEYAFEHFMRIENEEEFDSKLRQLKELTLSSGMRMIQMHAPYGDLDTKLGSNLGNERAGATRRVKRWLDYADQLGVDVLVMHTVFARQDVLRDSISTTRLIAEKNIQVFGELAEYARDFGVKIAIENRLESVFGCRITDLLEVVKKDPDHLGICLDTGHANVNEIDPIVAVKQAGNALMATHIHDNEGRGDQHLPPFMGNIDWMGFKRAIDDVKYDKPLIVEIPGSKSDLRVCDNRLLLTKCVVDTWLSGAHEHSCLR